MSVDTDTNRLGQDFKMQELFKNRGGENIVDLGSYAARRGASQTANAALKLLCRDILKHNIGKKKEDTFSDWNQSKLTDDQVKYAALDAIVHLDLLLTLDQKPDLTRRLTKGDDAPGKVVDIVPRNGSIICMASRAATATILEPHNCDSPSGIQPSVSQPGEGTVLVKLDKIYSPSLLVPSYWKEGLRSRVKPILGDFGKGGTVVLPLSVLKEHIPSKSIWVTPCTQNFIQAIQEQPCKLAPVPAR